jgi:hypothetical protein
MLQLPSMMAIHACQIRRKPVHSSFIGDTKQIVETGSAIASAGGHSHVAQAVFGRSGGRWRRMDTIINTASVPVNDWLSPEIIRIYNIVFAPDMHKLEPFAKVVVAPIHSPTPRALEDAGDCPPAKPRRCTSRRRNPLPLQHCVHIEDTTITDNTIRSCQHVTLLFTSSLLCDRGGRQLLDTPLHQLVHRYFLAYKAVAQLHVLGQIELQSATLLQVLLAHGLAALAEDAGFQTACQRDIKPAPTGEAAHALGPS